MASMLAVAVCAVLAVAVTFAAFADWARDLDPPAWGRLGFAGPIPVSKYSRQMSGLILAS